MFPHCGNWIILQEFVKIVLLTLSFELLSWYRHNLSLDAWNWLDQQLLEKTDMTSTQSNKTACFRFLIKYLRLKVVLQMICLVLVLLAPKLIFYMSTCELLFTNFKDTAFILRLAVQHSFAMMQCLENWVSSVRWRDHRQSYVNHLIQWIKSTHPDDWVQQNNQMAVVKCKCYTAIPRP